MAVEIGSAYFTLLPSMAGTAAAVRTGLTAPAVTGAFNAGGVAGGAALGAGLSKGISIAAIGVAAVGAASFFADSINAASDLNESANAVRVAFGDAADEVARLGETSAERLGVSQNDFNSYAVRFSAFVEKIAGPTGDIAGTLDVLTTRGADFASVFNVEVADALALFQSGLAGESEPLRRYGLDLSATTVEQTAYRLGIAEIGAALTEDQKIQARYAAILEQTAVVEGDRARTADEFANQQRENAAKWEDALARIGEALLPAATAFAAWIGDEKNIALLEKMVDLFVEAEPAISATVDALTLLVDLNLLGPLSTITDLFDALEDGKVTVADLYSILMDNNQVLADSAVGMATHAGNAVNGLIDAANGVIGAVESVVNAFAQLGGASIAFPRIPRIGVVQGVSMGARGRGGSVKTRMANGGLVGEAGWSWVGEHGPERLFLPKGAEVRPADSVAAGVTDLSVKTLRTLDEIIARRMALYVDGEDIAKSNQRGAATLAALGAS